MDLAYLTKLEEASRAPDSAFPSMLFEPLTNDFGDLYFKLEPGDYKQDAVKVDPRFTAANIRKIRGTAKTIYRYLEWTALWDDYMDYLTATYGSVDIAYQMYEAGTLPDPFPNIMHRPIMRKGKLRKLLRHGELVSYTPPSISMADTMDYFKEVLDKEEMPKFDEEPDIDWAMDHKPSKGEKEIMDRNAKKYRMKHRLDILISGTAANGVRSNADFIDNYYSNVESGVYDTQWTDHDSDGDTFVVEMQKISDARYRHEGQIIEDEQKAQGGRYIYDSHMIRDREKTELYTIYKHLQEYTGIDVMGSLSDTMSKKSFKAIRTGMRGMGIDLGLTKKERKKLKKKQKKIDNAQNRTMIADQKLSEILLNNKIFTNGGTVRFEDLMRRRDFDDED